MYLSGSGTNESKYGWVSRTYRVYRFKFELARDNRYFFFSCIENIILVVGLRHFLVSIRLLAFRYPFSFISFFIYRNKVFKL